MFFRRLFEAFTNIYSRVPNTDSQELLDKEMEGYLKDLSEFQENLKKDTGDFVDVKHYFESGFQKRVESIQSKIR